MCHHARASGRNWGLVDTTWDGANWTCEIELRTWRDHLPRGGSGRIRVVYTPEGATEDVPPSKVQLATVERLREEQAAVLDAMTSAMRAHYDAVRPGWLKHSVEHPGFFKNFTRQMPKAPDEREFARLHELKQIGIHPVARARLAYLGLAFRADWDVEHGLGVLVHGTRVVRVGGGDTAVLECVAREDAAVKRSPGGRGDQT